MVRVTVDQLAQGMNVSARRVQQLVAEGMPKAERGRYDLVTCLEWYVRYLQSAVERREVLTGKTTAEKVRIARVELLTAQKDKLTRENAEAQGQLIPLEIYRAHMVDMIVTARQRLLQMPDRVSAQLKGEPRAIIREKLRGEIHLALAALAAKPHEPGLCDVCGQPAPGPMDSASIAV